MCVSPQCTIDITTGYKSRPLRQDVFVSRRAFLVAGPPQHAVADKLLQPVRQQMPGNAEPRLKFLEAADPKKALAEDQEAPPVANDRNRARQRAWLFFKRVPAHPVLRR
jgi:hypothetical protein